MTITRLYLYSSLAVCGLAGAALAQTGQTPPPAPPEDTPSISIHAEGLSCSTPAGTGTFDATSWSMGAQNNTTATATGSGAGKVSVQDLRFFKSFDGCSPALFLAVASGLHLPRVTLTHAVATGDTKQTLMTVKLEDVVVSSYQLGGTPAAAEPGEQITLSFSKITITNSKNGVSTGWDIKTNKKV